MIKLAFLTIVGLIITVLVVMTIFAMWEVVYKKFKETKRREYVKDLMLKGKDDEDK